MGSMSIWHWIVVIAVVLLLFGRGKISDLMGDVAQGIKSFKKGMADDDTAKDVAPQIEPGKTEAAKTLAAGRRVVILAGQGVLRNERGYGTSLNLLDVLLHEFAHGLGFQTFTSGSRSRKLAAGRLRSDVYTKVGVVA